MNRFGFVSLAWLLLVGGCRPGAVDGPATDIYPQKTVTIVCPWAAGGGTDRLARFWADVLHKKLGKPFVVVNRTGGSGAIGHSAGASARPDGYTLTVITCELCTMHRLGFTDLTYQDFDCLLQMNADAAAIIVRDDARWNSLQDWLTHIQAKPKSVKMSGTATGGTWDLARAGLLLKAGLAVDSATWVPKDGAAPSLVELLGGHLDAVCCSVPEAAAQVDGGQVRVLAVMSEQRLPDYPDIPTAKEQGYDWVAVGWRGLALPKGTPQEIVTKLEDACREIAASNGFRDFMTTNRFGIEVRGAQEFSEFAAAQDEQWKLVVESAGYSK